MAAGLRALDVLGGARTGLQADLPSSRQSVGVLRRAFPSHIAVVLPSTTNLQSAALRHDSHLLPTNPALSGSLVSAGEACSAAQQQPALQPPLSVLSLQCVPASVRGGCSGCHYRAAGRPRQALPPCPTLLLSRQRSPACRAPAWAAACRGSAVSCASCPPPPPLPPPPPRARHARPAAHRRRRRPGRRRRVHAEQRAAVADGRWRPAPQPVRQRHGDRGRQGRLRPQEGRPGRPAQVGALRPQRRDERHPGARPRGPPRPPRGAGCVLLARAAGPTKSPATRCLHCRTCR
jgi:hypothetical protein